MAESLVEEALALSARHVTAAPVEDDDVLLLRISDGEQAVEITPEIGSPEASARALLQLSDAIREYAEHLRCQARMRNAGRT